MKLRNNKDRARLAIVFLWIMLGLSFLTLLINFFQLQLLYEVRDYGYYRGASTIVENAETIIVVAGLVGIILLALSILSWVFYIQWFRRAYFNMHTIKNGRGLRYTEGWAAGAWFVPIFMWWGPYQIMRDLYDNAQRMLIEKGLISEDASRINTVNIWWGLWIGGNIIQTISNQGDKLGTIDGQIIFVYLGFFSTFLTIGAAIYAVKVVKNYSAMEELLPQVLETSSNNISMDSSDLLDS